MINDNAASIMKQMNFYIIAESSKFTADTDPEYYTYNLFDGSKLIGKFVHNMKTGGISVYHSNIDLGDGADGTPESGWLYNTADNIQDAIRIIKDYYLITITQ
jgi:hypothetical protein